MDLEQGLVAHLRADATVGPLVANGDGTYRIYHEILPQDVVYPAIVYARTSTTRQMTLAGPSDISRVTLAIDCFGATTAAMKQLAAAVKASLDGLQGNLGGVTVQHCFYESETDLSEFSGDRDDRRISFDFVVWLNE